MHAGISEFLDEQTKGLAELSRIFRKSRVAAARRLQSNPRPHQGVERASAQSGALGRRADGHFARRRAEPDRTAGGHRYRRIERRGRAAAAHRRHCDRARPRA